MNPHTRYEIPLDRNSGRIAIAAILLACVSVLAVMYLMATTPGAIPKTKLELPKVNMPSAVLIQQELDANNPVQSALSREVR